MSLEIPRSTQRRWLVAGAVLCNLAYLPYHWLPEPLEAWLPALFILLGPAPILAAFASGGGARRGAKVMTLWFGGGGLWLTQVEPQLGIFAWLFMSLTMAGWGLLFGAIFGALRERLGPGPMLAASPLAWAGWEMVRCWTPIGTAWCGLAHAWWKLPALLQPCELTGYRGISAVIACFAAAGAYRLVRLPGGRRMLAIAAGLTAACWLYGLAAGERWRGDEGEPVTAALIQANVPLAWKQGDQPVDLFVRHAGMSWLVEPPIDLIVWPETAVPAQIFAIDGFVERMAAIARAKQATLVATGADVIPPDDPESRIYTNAAVVYGPSGERVGHYHKVHLVILGEYIPGRNWPLLRWIAGQSPQYYGGWEYAAVDTPAGRYGFPICYESIFPQDCRGMVRNGAEALFMLTNDDQLTAVGGRQHYQQAIFRAIELRRWVARCANCGISAFIDPSGRVHEQTGWGEQTILRGTLHRRSGLTVYARWGDWFGWLCLLLPAGAVVRATRRSA